MIDICIFPIPGCVTFPGTVFPLHVFEPRYRAMIQYCLETDTPVAICHTRKLVSAGKPNENLKEALSSNQATFRPYDVFSAGLCELQNTTEDGRLYLNVHIQQRYRMVSEKQLLPFQVYQCEVFPDVEPEGAQDKAEQHQRNQLLKDKIFHRLAVLGQGEATIEHLLTSPQWQQKSAQDFSFELFSAIHFGPELRQEILAMDSVSERLEYTLTLLNQV